MELPENAVVFHHKFPFNERECEELLEALHEAGRGTDLIDKMARYIQDMNAEWAQREELMKAMGAHDVTSYAHRDKP